MDPFPFDEVPDDLIWANILPALCNTDLIVMLERAFECKMHTFICRYIFPAIRMKTDPWQGIGYQCKARIILHLMKQISRLNIDALYFMGVRGRDDNVFWDEYDHTRCEMYRLMILIDMDYNRIIRYAKCEPLDIKQHIMIRCIQMEKLHILQACLDNRIGVGWPIIVQAICHGHIAPAKVIMNCMKKKRHVRMWHHEACMKVETALVVGDFNFIWNVDDSYTFDAICGIKDVIYHMSMNNGAYLMKGLVKTLRQYFKLINMRNFMTIISNNMVESDDESDF